MFELKGTHTLTSKPVDLSSQKPANPARDFDQAMTELWSEKHQLEGIIQMLCHTDELHLENEGLEGFRNILGKIKDVIDCACKCKDALFVFHGDETIFETIHRHAMNKGFLKAILSEPEAPVKDAIVNAYAAFNSCIAEEYRKHGLDVDESPCYYAARRANAVAEAKAEVKEDAESTIQDWREDERQTC